MTLLSDIDARSRAIFKELVDAYLETGQPVGSRTLSRMPSLDLSPATIRNVMSDLAAMGLLDSPHASAGRMPTERGLRLFVDGLMQVGAPTPEERRAIDEEAEATGESPLDRAAARLSGLTRTATLVVTQKSERPLSHVSFVPVDERRALMVMVNSVGDVENRLIAIPPGLPQTALIQAANFLNAHMIGHTLAEASDSVLSQIDLARGALDELTKVLVREGLADLSKSTSGLPHLIVKGQSNLLADADNDLEKVQQLFDDIERKKGIVDVLDAARSGEGVRIFIGSENPLFSLSGSSVIAAPYRDAEQNIIGVVGVVGPTRLNYARVIPLVDYTAEVVGRLTR